MKDSLKDLANRYFNYLARSFPVMCASDEFHFIPRAEAARLYYDRIDNLDADAIIECLLTLRVFQNDFERLGAHYKKKARKGDASHHDGKILEKLIDIELLKASLAGFFVEMELKQSWRHNPLLYLKIAFIGLHHALSKPASSREEVTERVISRLQAIPGLLLQGGKNLSTVPAAYKHTAFEMLNDCSNYLIEIKSDLQKGDRRCTDLLEAVWSSLNTFYYSLKSSITQIPDHRANEPILETTLRDHFLSFQSLRDVFAIGLEEWNESMNQLEKIQKKIDPQKSWLQLYSEYCPSDVERMDTLTLYRHESEKLYSFFNSHGFSSNVQGQSLEICETPTYLTSIRGSASFSAAFSPDSREKNYFYITTRRSRQQSEEVSALTRRRLHREYKFLTAHETFPGHYLLDFYRRKLKNPVRRQIESPLFYEGWAYYAESLLTEYGYINSPIEQLVNSRRSLWRAARCQIDVGLNTGGLSWEKGMELLKITGLTHDEAAGQIKLFQLNPGYQLCYSLGRYEILKLRKIYGKLMERESFHARLIEGGELPFHLIAKRFENLIQNSPD